LHREISTWGDTYTNDLVNFCNGNSYDSGGTCPITKVEIIPYLYTYYGGAHLQMIYDTDAGEVFDFPDDDINTVNDPKDSIDITDDTNAPEDWEWSDIESLKTKISFYGLSGGGYGGAGYIKIIVTCGEEEEPEEPAPVFFSNMAFFTLNSTTASSTEYYFASTTLNILNSQNQFYLLLLGVIIFLLTAIFIFMIFK